MTPNQPKSKADELMELLDNERQAATCSIGQKADWEKHALARNLRIIWAGNADNLRAVVEEVAELRDQLRRHEELP
jgi:hypothetical protein